MVEEEVLIPEINCRNNAMKITADNYGITVKNDFLTVEKIP